MVFNTGGKTTVLEGGFLEPVEEMYPEISGDDALTRYEQQF